MVIIVRTLLLLSSACVNRLCILCPRLCNFVIFCRGSCCGIAIFFTEPARSSKIRSFFSRKYATLLCVFVSDFCSVSVTHRSDRLVDEVHLRPVSVPFDSVGDFLFLSNIDPPFAQTPPHKVSILIKGRLPGCLAEFSDGFTVKGFAIHNTRDFKIQRSGRQRERQRDKRFYKQNNNFARASHSFVHFFARFARLRRENAYFVFYRVRKQATTKFYFSFSN